MSDSGKSGGDDVKLIPKYYLDLHLGVCLGPVQSIRRIIIGDRLLWGDDAGENPITQSRIWNIDDPDLFGGLEREGGVRGSIAFLLGHDSQVIPYSIAKIINPDLMSISEPYPNYRGIATLFFSRRVKPEYNGMLIADVQDKLDLYDSSERESFYWRANSRVLPPIKVEVEHFAAPNELHGKIARYPQDDRSKDTLPWDDNPAFIIRRLMIDRNFGAGVAQPHFNEESFRIAAAILHTEGLGITYPIYQSAEIDKIINDVLRHIDAFAFEDGRTGQMSIRLLREPTDAELKKYPEATPANSQVTAFKIQGEELINQLDVTHTREIKFEDVKEPLAKDPVTDEPRFRFVRKARQETNRDDSVTVQDTAAMTADAGVIAESRTYTGIYNPATAQRIAERDLIAAAYPLAYIEMDLFNDFVGLSPGDILRVSSPEDSPHLLNMRVMNITESLDGGKMLRVNLAEDAYSRSKPPEYPTPTGELERNNVVPTNDYQVRAITLPYIMASRAGVYEEDFVHFAALVSTPQIGVTQFLLEADGKSILGNDIIDNLGVGKVVGRGTLPVTLPAAVVSNPARFYETIETDENEQVTESITDFFDMDNADAVEVNDIMMIILTDAEGKAIRGADGNYVDELVGIKNLWLLDADKNPVTDADGKRTPDVVLIRGMFDTIPRDWPRGHEFFVLPQSAFFFDRTRRTQGEELSYRIYPIGTGGILPDDLAYAAQEARPDFVLTDRPHNPYRPANVKVGGVAFGSFERPPRDTAGISISWANRNRITENDEADYWNDANRPPEPLQRTLIELFVDDVRHHYHIVEPAPSGHVDDYPQQYTMPIRHFREGNTDSGDDLQYVSVCVSSVLLNPDFKESLPENEQTNPRWHYKSISNHVIQVRLNDITGYGAYINQQFGL